HDLYLFLAIIPPPTISTLFPYTTLFRSYFHRFYEFQPDLNTSNPEVQAEILKIMGFWIQLGVSGFRMDAVPFVIATKGANVSERSEEHTSELQSRGHLVCRLLLEKKNNI